MDQALFLATSEKQAVCFCAVTDRDGSGVLRNVCSGMIGSLVYSLGLAAGEFLGSNEQDLKGMADLSPDHRRYFISLNLSISIVTRPGVDHRNVSVAQIVENSQTLRSWRQISGQICCYS